MRILIDEWCSSGGMQAAGLADDGLAREGTAMLEAVVGDAAAADDLTVTVLVAAGVALACPPGVRVVRVDPGAHDRLLEAEASRSESALLVAPETDGILADLVARVRATGCRPLASADPFLRLAADKHATAVTLAGAGVPVPAGCSLPAGGGWPAGFHLPAVRKSRGGAGGDGLVVVDDTATIPPPPSGPARLEAHVPGLPVGVSCLCGPLGSLPIAVMEQRFTGGRTPRYLGSQPVVDAGIRRRAETLADRAIAAVGRAAGGAALGWVGVDMILGAREDGRGDRVLEINPRLTSSVVGVAAAWSGGLIRSLVTVAAGGSIDRPPPRPLPFRLVP